jgi:hypothetical protein
MSEVVNQPGNFLSVWLKKGLTWPLFYDMMLSIIW